MTMMTSRAALKMMMIGRIAIKTCLIVFMFKGKNHPSFDILKLY